jgi:hypothetical protein
VLPKFLHGNEIYSGIDGIHLQDKAIAESVGPIAHHSLEHPAPSDQNSRARAAVC